MVREVEFKNIEWCNLPLLGSISNVVISLSATISNWRRDDEELTSVKDLVSVYITAQYSKSRPAAGMQSMTLAKFNEVIFDLIVSSNISNNLYIQV